MASDSPYGDGSRLVLFMDPPRQGSTPEFIRAAVSMNPARIVYISCAQVRSAGAAARKNDFFELGGRIEIHAEIYAATARESAVNLIRDDKCA